MSKKVSMEDIANKLGISKNSVSLALRGLPIISEQTRNLILETAEQMGYQYKPHNGQKIPDKNPATKNICLIMSKSTRDTLTFFNKVQFGIEDEAKKNNLNTIIHYYNDEDDTFETPLSIREGMISGIITLGRISEKVMEVILNYQRPVVMTDHYIESINVDCILSDNQSGGYTATDYLIQSGHKTIGFIGNITYSPSFYDRFQGFLKAMALYHLDTQAEHLLSTKSFEHLSRIDMTVVTNDLKSIKKMPSAFFCCNDAEAVTLIKALNILDIHVPSDISVMGFDDSDFAKSMTPELTTMSVEKELMGKKAVMRLLVKMSENCPETEKLLLSTSLIERCSVRKK